MNIKAIFIHVALLLFCANSMLGQNRTETYNFNKVGGKSVLIALNFADTIWVYGTNENAIKLVSEISVNNNTDNNIWKLNVTETKNDLVLKTDLADLFAGKKRTIVKNDTVINGNCLKTDITHKLYVPKNQFIELKTLGGSYIVSNISGPIEINSLSGFIDFSWLPKQAATFDVHSLTGEVFSDLGLNFDTENHNSYVPIGKPMKSDYLGGGSKIKLKTLSNHIFIRAAK